MLIWSGVPELVWTGSWVCGQRGCLEAGWARAALLICWGAEWLFTGLECRLLGHASLSPAGESGPVPITVTGVQESN